MKAHLLPVLLILTLLLMTAEVWAGGQDLPIFNGQWLHLASIVAAAFVCFSLLRRLIGLRQQILLRVASSLALLAFGSLGCEAYIQLRASRLHDDAGLILFFVSVPLSLVSALLFLACILAQRYRRLHQSTH